jgi:predicted GIY-YIG superfamily endonuclease
MSSGIIYKITNLKNNKIYIGKTINLEERIKKYKRVVLNKKN